jgi:hypothetical protein
VTPTQRTLAPRSLDPIQQTVATAIQGYLSHPDVDSAAAVDAIKFISQPMRRTQVTALRAAVKAFQRSGQIRALLDVIVTIRAQFGEPADATSAEPKQTQTLTRNDLRLICFDVISS